MQMAPGTDLCRLLRRGVAGVRGEVVLKEGSQIAESQKLLTMALVIDQKAI
jgi:hypothetical protein